MPYKVGAKGSYGCDGYPAVKEGGEVMGCHKTRAAAAGQIYAINRSEGNIGKAMVKEGDMVIAGYEDEFHIGRVVHVMTEGMLGYPDSEYSLTASAEEPALLIQLFEMEEEELEETEYFVGHKASEVMVMPALESNISMDKSMHDKEKEEEDVKKEYEGCGCPTCKELNVNCENCPVCQEEDMEDGPDAMDAYDNSIGKAKKPNYGAMIKPRRGGSNPSDPKLYARVVQAAKDKFDVYPSAVANAWVVQEYKRRGGTYKSDAVANKSVWGGSLFDPKGFRK